MNKLASLSQYGLSGANVRIRLYDGITKTLKAEIEEHNITTSFALMSVAKLVYGIYDSFTPDKVSVNVPHYVAVGTGNSAPDVTDNALDDEVIPLGYDLNRIKITSREIVPDLANKRIAVNFKTYVPTFVRYQANSSDASIAEVGLFSQLTGNNCWARVVLETPVTKAAGDVLDILWTINIQSLT